MTDFPTRRRVLQLTGVGATASLAGCTQFDIPGIGSDDSAPELETDQEPGIEPTDGITASVQPSQAERAQIQQEVMAEAGEDASQEELMAEIEQRETELFRTEAVEFESAMLDEDDISLEGAIAEQGAFLLDGPDERLVDLLRNGEVAALLPGEDYEIVLQQVEGEGQEPAPEPEPEPEDEQEADEEDEGDDGDADGDDGGDTDDDEAAGDDEEGTDDESADSDSDDESN
ncbi:uncharacterized protein Nmag_0327 [Natrialba magadii ATCC 43099]|uniref:Uncharacterized protein n=1 Tax=Natrialba magadii (strain ATCC 43099 / DSM 3394 / CCM 3739 / CIP 104546 / IAM 13178 / JCM 8861 / NBRC 102185 / NCIMB 2190 / MS3) TaxID=547559 RepID=D3SX98_NATMM|nr:hypothetical protein [Natrialba magadii]ADD03918.1 uncharacterized protein Nmag_0327 [Natrialba magadii ATCC 43099]ELY33579.1 hypothetical protein C500_02065 [Natrialba magadii ATCC 43099]